MLALRLFRERMFRIANVVQFCSTASLAGVTFLMPLFLQQLHGLSAADSGFLTFWSAIGMVVASQIAGRLYHSVGPRRLLLSGLSAMVVISSSFMAFSEQTGLWVMGVLLFLRGLALGFIVVPLMTASFANVTVADTGRAASITSVARQVSASLGVAITGTAFAEALQVFGGGDGDGAPSATLPAYRVAFFVIFLLAVVATSSALLIRDRDAVSTMRRRAPSEQSSASLALLD